MARRRTVLTGAMGGVAASVCGTARAATAEIVPLWPGDAPGGEGVTVTPRFVPRSASSGPEDIAHYGIRRPTLGIVRPERSNGHALLVIPGGSYQRVASHAGGGPLARFLAARGFTVGTLLYRLPYDGWAAGPDAPLQDAQRALRLLRHRAGSGMRTSVLGFSAGGHLAGRLATRFASPAYAAADAVDAQPLRPDFAGLFYPVVTMTAPNGHAPSRGNLLGAAPDARAIADWSLEQRLVADMPPTFVTAAADDTVVPVENSLMLFDALRDRRVPCALHIFDVGGHAFGNPGDASGPGRFWPDLFQDWLFRQKPVSP
jgi:acetyl esterase/lipase